MRRHFMTTTKKLSWKKWSAAGLVIGVAGFTVTATSGTVYWLNHLAVAYQATLGASIALTSSCLVGSIAAIRNHCRKKKADEKNLLETAMVVANNNFSRDLENPNAEGNSQKTIIKRIGSSSDFDMEYHAVECNKLIEEYNRAACDPDSDLDEYLLHAERLQKQFFAAFPQRNLNYFAELKRHEYQYDQPPVLKIKSPKLDLVPRYYTAPIEISPTLKTNDESITPEDPNSPILARSAEASDKTNRHISFTS